MKYCQLVLWIHGSMNCYIRGYTPKFSNSTLLSKGQDKIVGIEEGRMTMTMLTKEAELPA
jgi:hypothetical protein